MAVSAAMGIRQGVVVGFVAAALGVLVAQPLAGAAAILPRHAEGPAVSGQGSAVAAVQQLTVPSASVPAVTVPSVTTPVGTTPSVTTPSVTTPPVTTAPATTPSVSVPSVTTPAVSTPVANVPSVTTPSVSPTSAPGAVHTTASRVSALVGGATHSAQASGAPEDPASAAPDPTAAVAGTTGRLTGPLPTARGVNTASSASPATTGGMTSTARAAFASGRRGAPAHRSDRARRTAAARESRRLRRLVARLRGCLRTLGVGARRLLSLRAGLHGPARSAAATAHILHVSTRREARLERRALAALQRSAGTGCAGPVPAAAPGLAPATSGSASASLPGGSAAPAGPAASLSAAHAERGPAGGRPLTPMAPARRVVERAETGSSFPSLLIPALLALLLGLAVLAMPETRRRLRPAAAAHPPAGAAPDAAALQIPQPRLPLPKGPRHTPMDAAMAQMAADVFAAMAGETVQPEPGAAQPQSQPEGDTSHPQAPVEAEE